MTSLETIVRMHLPVGTVNLYFDDNLVKENFKAGISGAICNNEGKFYAIFSDRQKLLI